MEILENLKKLRIEAGMTQKELASKLSITVRHLQYIEKGETVPTFPIVVNWLQKVGYDFFLKKNEKNS